MRKPVLYPKRTQPHVYILTKHDIKAQHGSGSYFLASESRNPRLTQASSFGICGMQNNTGTSVVSPLSISPVSIIPSMQQTHSSTNGAT